MWRECKTFLDIIKTSLQINIFSTLASNAIASIPSGVFSNLQYLKQVELRGNPIHFYHPDAFIHLPSLNKLQMLGSPGRDLNTFPNLTGSPMLELIHLDRLNLASVPENICSLAPRLHTLWVGKFLIAAGSLSHCLLFSGDSEATSWQIFPFWQTVRI